MTDTKLDPLGADVGSHPLLEAIQSPMDLKALERNQLPALCAEIRSFLLESVQTTGGHLGSNLGVVELTVALHRVFDLRRDRCVWDVSHQAYVHKLLTGRRADFAQLRKTGGMCGFTNPAESEYDLFHTGHAGTSISAALGLAISGAHEADRPHAISVIGDASLGAGVAFEALSNAGASGQRMLVVLNDNEWSISKSVGALARYLTRIRSARVVQRAQQEIHGLLQSIPLIGNKIEDTIDQVREVLRHTIVQGHVFEELGVTYVGPVDGHDIHYLEEQLRRVRKLDGVVLLHTLTQKGKGHPDALSHPERVHAAKPAKKKEKPSSLTEKLELAAETAPLPAVSYTQAFANSLRGCAERDLRVHVITAGMPSGTGLTDFAERFPNRFHDVGICEQHGVAMAAGMCKGGLRPVVAIYSTFLQRAYDQVFQEAALQGLPVVFCMDRAGLVGQDGPTHHGVFDIAYLRTLPGFVICAPRDASDMRRMLEMGLRYEDGPVGIRYPRDNCVPAETEMIPVPERAEMQPGKAEVLVEGGSIMLWVSGALVRQARIAVEKLRQAGVDVGLVDARFIKPLDEELLSRHLHSVQHVIVVEEHQRAGGFGSAVLEAGSRLPDVKARIRILGIPDRYIDHMTTRDEQLSVAGIDAAAIEKACLSVTRTSQSIH
jgi:1-deoxy-D-xylulose-5-phosphate synthase